jgi:hypothetical protein
MELGERLGPEVIDEEPVVLGEEVAGHVAGQGLTLGPGHLQVGVEGPLIRSEPYLRRLPGHPHPPTLPGDPAVQPDPHLRELRANPVLPGIRRLRA